MQEEIRSSVLIVDDNSRNLQVLADILRGGAHKVATAKDGFKALNFIKKIVPDIVLLDIMMPGMDGFEVCGRLKRAEKTRDIPVIFISALSDTIDKVRGFEAGGVDYITKPFQKEEVIARVNAHLKLKRAREELKRANRLLRTANATRDKLFSIIAHDLRGPVGTLKQGLEMLVEKPDSLAGGGRAFLAELAKVAAGGNNLLENLLCWAGSQRGKIDFAPVHLELAIIVDANIELFAGVANNKSIRLVSDVDPAIRVYVDLDMIMTVFRNLISNALKFTPGQGEVRVSAVPAGDMVEAAVTDTGVGIGETNMKRLFRVEEHFTTFGTQNEKGSGLGLLLCKEFVEKNGGEIRVESREGKGSAFRFTLQKADRGGGD